MLFDVWNLVLIIVAVYATFSVFQSNSAKGKLLSGVVGSGVLAFLVYRATGVQAGATVGVDAPIFQQFNPFYVVALTPVSMAIFGALAKSGKEPSAPRKIAYGMLVAALGFVVMVFGSKGLNTPTEQQSSIVVEKSEKLAVDMHKAQGNDKALEKVKKDKEAFEKKLNDAIDDAKKDKDAKKIAESEKLLALYNDVYGANTTILTTVVPEVVNTPEAPLTEEQLAAANAAVDEAKNKIATAEKELAEIKANTKPATRVSSYWLILTYLILTFAELLLSPMGISFVTKVAPPKYKGLMMGGWFVATAIGNFLVAVGGLLWGGIPLTIVWSVFVVLCLLSALFMFVMMKRLESATK